jgi:hypothetical protein
MRVISISVSPSEVTAFKPSQHFTRMRAMPCEVVECYTPKTVYKHGDSADVILLPGAESSWPPFWNDIAEYVESLPAFVGIFSIDSYRTVWLADRKQIKFDVLFPLMYTAYRDHEQELDYGCKHIFWSPCCVGVQNDGTERDIDVLFWGNPDSTSYPFRNFILRELTRYSSLEEIEGELILNNLRLDGWDYRYARLPYRNTGYWGRALYPLLERARICCAGSMDVQVPHPKYFENAACGCVTISNDFSDREALGFEHGRNIWITNQETFIKDLTFLLENEDLVAEMSANARQLIAERHTVRIRADELYQFLRGLQ